MGAEKSSRKGRTTITDIVKLKLKDAIWVCKIGRFNAQESINYINSGVLGFERKKKESDKDKPIKISERTFYRVKAEIDNPENQLGILYETARKGMVEQIASKTILYQMLEADSMKNMIREKDPSKKQMIINSMYNNSLYPLNLADLVRNMIEKNFLESKEELEKKLKSTNVGA